MEKYFKDHSDEDLARLAIEHIRFGKTVKKVNPNKLDKEPTNQFFQELQLEIVNRFIDANRPRQGED